MRSLDFLSKDDIPEHFFGSLLKISHSIKEFFALFVKIFLFLNRLSPRPSPQPIVDRRPLLAS